MCSGGWDFITAGSLRGLSNNWLLDIEGKIPLKKLRFSSPGGHNNTTWRGKS